MWMPHRGAAHKGVIGMIRILSGESFEGKEYIESIEKRAGEIDRDVTTSVCRILDDIRSRGDDALIEYTRKFDSQYVLRENLRVSEEEINRAYENVDKDFIEAITFAEQNIREFHENQKQRSWMAANKGGVIMGQTVRALDTVGIYVPGGKASYPSSVIMNSVPARVAGVKKLVMAAPPSKDGSINPYILAAARIAGVDAVYRMGGAQAIGAMAYGTENIPRVDKIVGPGNIYVAAAKRAVFGYVDIDMIAGPSEILIISDEKGDARFIAADLMSQAEHDEMASAVLVTTSMELALRVKDELELMVREMDRSEIIISSLKDYGAIIVVGDMKEAVRIANKISPEHLEIMLEEPFNILGDIKNAGSIFLGKYSPEPLGDYMAGPNHVLPTCGTARFFSPLSVDDFIKKSSYIYYDRDSLYSVREKIIKLAEVEGLTAHGNSIKVRFE